MQQRNVRAIVALGCAVALLLLVFTIFDDDFFDKDAFDELFVAVAAFVITAALMALALVETQRRPAAVVCLAVLSDPRSPPRR
jgi:hypothetical protein